MEGIFILNMIYNKSAKTFDEQLEKFKQRGLEIEDEEFAKFQLSTIGYYRLTGYWWSMLADKKKRLFKPNSKFSNIINIYNFDKELRILLFDVIESIEISFRTKLIYHTSLETSPWWFEDISNFKNEVHFVSNLESIDRELTQTKENFIKEHYKKYTSDERRPPAWKTLEITSFGTISKLYHNLANKIKSKNIIAMEFGAVNHYYLRTWLQSITQIRNIIAHHGRLWNKNLPGTPKLLSKPPFPWLINVPDSTEFYKLYTHLCLMKYLLNIIKPNNSFTNDLMLLFDKYNNIDQSALGMKKDWFNEPLWKN